MNISVLQENLLKALVRAGRIISNKPQLPILQNILLETQDGRFRIVATNIETIETVWVGAKIEKEGSICVSSRLLTELVSSFPSQPISLKVADGALQVQSMNFQATIPGIGASEFPPISIVKKIKSGKHIDKEILLNAFHRVLFAAATDEGRPLLTGVKIKKQDQHMVFAATDGYRLSVQTIEFPKEELGDMVVPAKALGEMMKIAQEEKDVKELSLSQSEDGQLVVTIGDSEITTRLIDGEYPNFTKIVPSTFTTRLTVDTSVLTKAVKSAAIFARDNANIIKFHIEDHRFIVSANTPQVGENHIEVEAKIEGEGGEVAFNSRFLLEFLNNFPEDELVFEMTGSLNPGVFRPVKDESYLHIIMPVRVQN